MEESEDKGRVMEEMMGLIETIGSYAGGYRTTHRKECMSLVRRLNLMLPLLHELKDCCPISDHHHEPMMTCLVRLKKALFAAKKLLHKCCSGSKIYLALESEAVMASFHGLYDKLNEALDGLPYDELGISHEVKEQVELMQMQLKRAKKRADTQDIELAMDMMVVFSETEEDRNTDSAILERLANKLELHTIADLKQETAAVKKLAKDRSVQRSESIRRVMDLLRKLKRIEGIDEGIELEGSISSKVLQRCQSSLIPHEFLCPITLEIMVDPVIVKTGQTYKRESIQKWLDSNRRTCPKTGQTLKNLSLAPNFALRNLILKWCEKNNFELPKKDACQGSDTSSIELTEKITALVEALSFVERVDRVREAVRRIRMLSKENPDNRVLIANNGGILPLINLLSHPDANIQEQAVTALLNLSIDASNKRIIAREGAIPGIVAILRDGTDEARENSAAALFSLSMLEENKPLVGALQGIPPLVELLRSGTIRGKKDAATALFNLCMNKGNKSRAIKAGVVAPLLELLEDRSVGMVDEGLSIMLLLASHPEGRMEMGRTPLVETLVSIIRNGTAKNKECAASVLLELGHKDEGVIRGAVRSGVYDELVEMARSGTNRARRKANVLLHHITSLDLAS